MYKNTVKNTLLKILLYKCLSYKDVDRMLKKHRVFENIPTNTIRVTLTRLKNQGLVRRTEIGWEATETGRNLTNDLKNKPPKYRGVFHKNKKHDQYRVIIFYDIPEKHKQKRNWLRKELRSLGFKMKQQSAWIGPAPLPQEFITMLNRLNLLEYLNFFRVREEEIV